MTAAARSPRCSRYADGAAAGSDGIPGWRRPCQARRSVAAAGVALPWRRAAAASWSPPAGRRRQPGLQAIREPRAACRRGIRADSAMTVLEPCSIAAGDASMFVCCPQLKAVKPVMFAPASDTSSQMRLACRLQPGCRSVRTTLCSCVCQRFAYCGKALKNDELTSTCIAEKRLT